MTLLSVSAYVSPVSNTLLWEIEEGNFLPFIQISKLHIYQMLKYI